MEQLEATIKDKRLCYTKSMKKFAMMNKLRRAADG